MCRPKGSSVSDKDTKLVNLGYKYRIYPSPAETTILEHQMFVYNQTYNICLNLWNKERERNRDLVKKDRHYRSAVSYDKVVKRVLRRRKISFSTVVTQQSRIRFLEAAQKAISTEVVAERSRAIAKAKTPKEMAKALSLGFPKFKSSKGPCQSFVWNNQSVSVTHQSGRFATLKIMKQNIKLRYHRELPESYKLTSAVISRDSTGYYASIAITFKKEVGRKVSIEGVGISESVGIDMNAYNFAASSDMDELMSGIAKINSHHLIDNGARDRRSLRDSRSMALLEKKQSRRVLKAKNTKTKLGRNHKKTKKKLNKLQKKITNKKTDLYHKISTRLSNTFDVIAVEDLKLKNQMTKSAKGNELKPGKKVKQKAGLNKTILRASFYQFSSMLEYKQSLNDKVFVKVDPKNTSITCLECGNIDKANRPKQEIFKCTSCSHSAQPDVQAAVHIEYRGLQSLGSGHGLADLKRKAFRSASQETAS